MRPGGADASAYHGARARSDGSRHGGTGPGRHCTAGWDQLVAAAQKEGKVVVSGPPDPDARTRLPAAFKQRFNIEMEYLAGNSSQLASRIAERASRRPVHDRRQHGLAPTRCTGRSFRNNWLDPIKPVLMLPEVLDPKVWPTGRPWFRDPSGETSLQIFNTISPIGYINTTDRRGRRASRPPTTCWIPN